MLVGDVVGNPTHITVVGAGPTGHELDECG